MNPAWWLGLLAAVSGGGASEGRRAVVVTTDIGAEVDDQWALAHLALTPRIDLQGVVTTHAPSLAAPAAETSAREARDVLGRLGLKEAPPVIAGSSRPLADRATPRSNLGVDFLIERAKGHDADDRLVVVVIGAATDVASALLTDPTWADRVEIVAMAFSKWPEGGDPWNVKNDVNAWQVLLESRAPIVVGDAAVTARDLAMTPNRARRLFDGRGEVGAYLLRLLESWLAKHPDLAESVAHDRTTWPIWDEVATAYLMGLTETERRPRPTLRDDSTFDHGRTNGSITWVTKIDSAQLWKDLAARLPGPR